MLHCFPVEFELLKFLGTSENPSQLKTLALSSRCLDKCLRNWVFQGAAKEHVHFVC